MVRIIFNYKPKKELIKYFALLLHLHTKNYLKKYKLPCPLKIDKETLWKFKKLLNEETGYYYPLTYLLFNKGLNKDERRKLNGLLKECTEIDKNYQNLIKKNEELKEKLERLKPKIAELLNYAQQYTKMKFVPKKIIAIMLPYTNGASSLQFENRLYICFRTHRGTDVRRDRILYLILHECLHLLNLLPSNSKMALELNKKHAKKHIMYGEFSNIINESFSEAIECRIAVKKEKITKNRLEFLKFGKTKLFFEQLRDKYEKNRKYKNIKQFGLEIIRKSFL